PCMSHPQGKYTRRLCPRISHRRRVTARGQDRYKPQVPRLSWVSGPASRLGTGAARGARLGKQLVSSNMTGKQYRQTLAGTYRPDSMAHQTLSTHKALVSLFHFINSSR